MMSVTSAIDALSMANRVLQQNKYEWHVAGIDDREVPASNGLTMNNSIPFSLTKNLDVLFVCAGDNVEKHWSEPLGELLRYSAHTKIGLGGIFSGTYLLAKARVLNGVKCTIHWPYLETLRGQFSTLQVTNRLFEIDGRRYTCAGGDASFNMMINLIARECGQETSRKIAENLCMERIRDLENKQLMTVKQFALRAPEYFSATIQLMHNNIEEPLQISELAELTKVSKRQLERAFIHYLQSSPQRYYLNLRLRHGQYMVQYSGLSIGEIAFACGFKSIQHFSKSYKNVFSVSPRNARTSTGVGSSNAA